MAIIKKDFGEFTRVFRIDKLKDFKLYEWRVVEVIWDKRKVMLADWSTMDVNKSKLNIDKAR